MKARNLFLSLCTFAAICSCSKEIEPGVKDSEVLAEDTFIKINIAAPSVASKGIPRLYRVAGIHQPG